MVFQVKVGLMRSQKRQAGVALGGLLLTWAGAAACGSSPAGRAGDGQAAGTPKPPAIAQTIYAYVTYTGWYDNPTPGCRTVYHTCAGGTGTYSDPITFGSDPAEFRPGSRLYYPTVEKYFVMGDQCVACEHDWRGKGPDGGPHMYHVNVWVGGKGSNEYDQFICEDGLTQGTPSGAPMLTPMIVNPPPGMPVSTQPLFDSRTDACFGGATDGGSQGQYKDAASHQCIVDPGNGALAGTPARVTGCNAGTAQQILFVAAFLTINNLCLDTQGGSSSTGTKIVFNQCLGGVSQQWEINNDGTISGVQSHGCIAQSGSYLRLEPCTAAATQRWAFIQAKL